MEKIDEITQQYLNECRKVFKNDKKMDKYFLKSLDFAVRLPNGLIAGRSNSDGISIFF